MGAGCWTLVWRLPRDAQLPAVDSGRPRPGTLFFAQTPPLDGQSPENKWKTGRRRPVGSSQPSDGPSHNGPALPTAVHLADPGAAQSSPGAVQNSPGAVQNSPRAVQNSHGVVQNSPGAAQNSPGAFQNSPGAVQSSQEWSRAVRGGPEVPGIRNERERRVCSGTEGAHLLPSAGPLRSREHPLCGRSVQRQSLHWPPLASNGPRLAQLDDGCLIDGAAGPGGWSDGQADGAGSRAPCAVTPCRQRGRIRAGPARYQSLACAGRRSRQPYPGISAPHRRRKIPALAASSGASTRHLTAALALSGPPPSPAAFLSGPYRRVRHCPGHVPVSATVRTMFPCLSLSGPCSRVRHCPDRVPVSVTVRAMFPCPSLSGPCSRVRHCPGHEIGRAHV